MFLSNAAIDSLSSKMSLISGFTSILPLSSSLNAGANCPHFEPTIVISSTTTGAKLNSFEAAIVLFKMSVPLGFVSAREVSNPEIEPVALQQNQIPF